MAPGGDKARDSDILGRLLEFQERGVEWRVGAATHAAGLEARIGACEKWQGEHADAHRASRERLWKIVGSVVSGAVLLALGYWLKG